jgi:hypothetical protein
MSFPIDVDEEPVDVSVQGKKRKFAMTKESDMGDSRTFEETRAKERMERAAGREEAKQKKEQHEAAMLNGMNAMAAAVKVQTESTATLLAFLVKSQNPSS